MLALFSYGRCSNSRTTWISTRRVASRKRSHSLAPSCALSCLLLGPATFSQGPAALAPSLLSACLESTRSRGDSRDREDELLLWGGVRSGATESKPDMAAEGRVFTQLSAPDGRGER